MNPNRVVIDTNVFISALLNPLGTPKKVINIAVSQFTILQSEATYQELATRISKKKWFFRTYTVENSSSSRSAQQCSKVDKYQSDKNSKP
ncbi:MAG: hypothetical protein RLZZ339_841 [Cyanobacteriota bacterium]|jgi:putative PIN family toxin of toxin-antitoxin system